MIHSQVLLSLVSAQRCLNAVAAGTTVQNGTGVNLAGFDGVLFVLGVGALTANQVTALKAQQSSDNASADAYDDLEGTLVGPLLDADGNKLLILDVYRPEKQWVRPVVNRATANAVIDFVLAIPYCSRGVPTSYGSTVAATKAVVTPAEGTA
ncbi:MAG: hypothetical protein KIS87_13530 [Phycisphaeraceae bacterium]|nr:hypothetical protein [Phycisphaeraceae bacterium]